LRQRSAAAVVSFLISGCSSFNTVGTGLVTGVLSLEIRRLS
jgi:hypothetical protein